MSAQLGAFQDPFASQYQSAETPFQYQGIDSFGGKVMQGFGLMDKNEYNRWLVEQDRSYERAATNSARAWDEYMDSTAVQRRMKDIEAAGLNPWLAIQSGVSAGSSGQTASSGSSARSKASSSGKDLLSTIAMICVASAKMLSILAA